MYSEKVAWKPVLDTKNTGEKKQGKEEDTVDEQFAGMGGRARSWSPGWGVMT